MNVQRTFFARYGSLELHTSLLKSAPVLCSVLDSVNRCDSWIHKYILNQPDVASSTCVLLVLLKFGLSRFLLVGFT